MGPTWMASVSLMEQLDRDNTSGHLLQVNMKVVVRMLVALVISGRILVLYCLLLETATSANRVFEEQLTACRSTSVPILVG